MKTKLTALLGVLAFALSIQGCQAQEAEKNTPTSANGGAVAPFVKNIHGDTYLKMRAENSALQLLDVRTPEEIAEGFIEYSSFANVQEDEFTEKACKFLNKSVPVVVYCTAGSRSARAADLLREAGFEQIYNLTGGITAWISEGKPTVK